MKLLLLALPILAIAALAEKKPESPFACDRAALTPEARKRHFDELGPMLVAARKAIRELPSGYEFEFAPDPATVQLVAEWAAGERLCCPFFEIELRMEREHGAFWLLLTGREGVKQFIKADFARMFPGATSSNSQMLDTWVDKVEELVIPAAKAMPEAKFTFVPHDGEFKGVRTFAEQLKHLAAGNYQLGAAALREQPPAGTKNEEAPETVQTRAQVLAYLEGSFAVLHRAARSLRDDTANDLVPINGKAFTSSYLVVDALVHAANHYGQMVEYLRMSGVVPPASVKR